MSVTIVDSETGNRALGSFRERRPGPEQDLLDWFLTNLPVKPRPAQRITVFREPRLESGFPDLVIVVWREGVAEEWTQERLSLTKADLQLAHYLSEVGSCAIKDLALAFSGAPSRVERLEAAGVVRTRGKRVYPASLNRTFAASRILAVEAKIGKWKHVTQQAFVNTWFATESVVLLPSVPRSGEVLDEARTLGLGVHAQSGEQLKAKRSRGPKSYGSWLFNEWAWRATL